MHMTKKIHEFGYLPGPNPGFLSRLLLDRNVFAIHVVSSISYGVHSAGNIWREDRAQIEGLSYTIIHRCGSWDIWQEEQAGSLLGWEHVGECR
jgi:hypothetical protein